jgi:uracil phosphoribosyltransferase
MHTILRNVDTSRDDFIFYAERLSTLIIEKYVTKDLRYIYHCSHLNA